MSNSIADLYDSEVLEILRVQQELRDRAADKRLNYNDFEREIKERFAAIGFEVSVNWYRFAVGDAEQDGAMPEVTINARIDRGHVFDPDKRVHEAVNNILQLPGEEGWIKTNPGELRRLAEGHSHGKH